MFFLLLFHFIGHALQILTLFANAKSWLVEFISTLGWLLSLITNVWLSDASSCGSGGSYSIGRTVDRSPTPPVRSVLGQDIEPSFGPYVLK